MMLLVAFFSLETDSNMLQRVITLQLVLTLNKGAKMSKLVISRETKYSGSWHRYSNVS